MILNINMFGVFVKFRINHKLSCKLIVAVKRCRPLLRITNVIQETMKPYGFFNYDTCHNVFWFYSWTSNIRLFLVNPTNWTLVEKNNTTTSKFAIIKIPNKISIRISYQQIGTLFTTIIKRGNCSTINILEDALNNNTMNLFMW
jgi:hypothetical protein